MSGGRWVWMGLVALAVGGTAGGATPVRVTFDLREVRTITPVVGVPGGLLVPLRAVSRALGGQMRWDEATKTALVEYRGRRLEVDERTRALRLNGRQAAGGGRREPSDGDSEERAPGGRRGDRATNGQQPPGCLRTAAAFELGPQDVSGGDAGAVHPHRDELRADTPHAAVLLRPEIRHRG